MDVIAKRSVPSIEKCVSEGHSVVIDGIYSMSEVEILRDEFGLNLCIVAIHSPSARRYALVQMRGIRPLSSEELFNRDAHEIKYLDKARPIVLADEHVVNDSSIENLEMHLKKVLQLRVSMVGGLDC
jgi:dephospho-CoA kinase